MTSMLIILVAQPATVGFSFSKANTKKSVDDDDGENIFNIHF